MDFRSSFSEGLQDVSVQSDTGGCLGFSVPVMIGQNSYCPINNESEEEMVSSTNRSSPLSSSLCSRSDAQP